MPKVSVVWGKGARWRKGAHFSTLNAWLASTAAVSEGLLEYSDEIRPFHDNENSAVGLLVSGATRAGFLPLTEYRLKKRSWHDGRQWKPNSRADLWFCTRGLAYSFEFKFVKPTANRSLLEWQMYWADRDIKRIPRSEYDHAFSGLIAPVDEDSSPKIHLQFAEEVDFWCTLEAAGNYKVFLYFNQKC